MSVKFEYSVESIVITSATGVEKEVKDLVTGISFFESLYSPYIKCELSIVDATNLIETMPIVGQEKVRVYIKDLNTALSIKRDFYISSVGNYNKGNSQASIYTLKLVTPEYMLSSVGAVSQSYSGPISEIVAKVVDNHLKSKLFKVEESSGNYKVVIPTWAPYQALNWLRKRAKNQKNYPFALYETLNDGLIFESYDSIINKETFNKYVHRSGSVAKDDADQKAAMMNTALQYDISNLSNTGKTLLRGGFGRKLHVIDHAKKSYDLLTYDYLEDFKKKERLDKFPYIVEDFKIDNKSLNQHDAIHTIGFKNSLAFNQLHNYNDEIEFTSLENEPFLDQLGLFKVNLTVKGRTNLSVGKVIDFEVERNRPTLIAGSKNSNEYLSGRYIVQNVHHKMEEGKYYIIMEIARESLGKKVK